MTISEAFIHELTHEAISTRKVLERIPESEFGFKPHEKSFSMGRLASHVAETPGWGAMILAQDELAFNTGEHKPWMAESQAELLSKFDEQVAAMIEALQKATDEQFMSNWKMLVDGRVVIDMMKVAALRAWVFNHLYHHRGQLSVYLRLRNIPVPAIYGPSADEGKM